MIVGLDSAEPQNRPTAVQLPSIQAAGVGLWGGYIATRSGVNLLSPWDLASFDIVRQLGSTPIAYCSGWDDPVALRTLAAQWNVRLCLDVENGIRGNGAWVQNWLDESGAGLYGQHYQDTNGTWHSIHLDRRAAFHVMSWYIGRDPGATWAGLTPADGSPLAWQWQGGHFEFGLDVDRAWYDDWFAGGEVSDMTPQESQQVLQQLSDLWSLLVQDADIAAGTGGRGALKVRLEQIFNAANHPATVDVNALAAALAPHLPPASDPQVVANDVVAKLAAQLAKS